MKRCGFDHPNIMRFTVPEPRIEFQPTPNPNAGKFILDREVVPGGKSRSFFTLDEARGDALGEALMGLDGVDNIFMVEDFVTVTRRPDADWQVLIPRVEAALRAVLNRGSGDS
jgi:hypothetical protein